VPCGVGRDFFRRLLRYLLGGLPTAALVCSTSCLLDNFFDFHAAVIRKQRSPAFVYEHEDVRAGDADIVLQKDHLSKPEETHEF